MWNTTCHIQVQGLTSICCSAKSAHDHPAVKLLQHMLCDIGRGSHVMIKLENH